MATTEIERASRESIARVLAGRENAPSSAAARIDLERRIAAYEARFGIESDHLAAAIDRGDLDESLDICNWLMDLALLRRVTPA